MLLGYQSAGQSPFICEVTVRPLETGSSSPRAVPGTPRALPRQWQPPLGRFLSEWSCQVNPLGGRGEQAQNRLSSI